MYVLAIELVSVDEQYGEVTPHIRYLTGVKHSNYYADTHTQTSTRMRVFVLPGACGGRT